MASAMRVFSKFRSSDGRIKVATLSGVSVMVAVIALLVGVLPVFASHAESKVTPVVVDLGGGPSHCSSTTDDGRLPSAAGKTFHINNPTGDHPLVDADGNRILVKVVGPTDNRRLSFEVTAGDVVVYDVVVNGGPKSNHYDYDDNVGATGSAPPGPVTAAEELHAPKKGTKLHNLSHINICYDVPGLTLFACDEPVKLVSDGLFAIAEATIFANSEISCDGKRGSFLIEDDGKSVTLAFEGDGPELVAGRLDVTKEFGSTPFEDLQYDQAPPFEETDFVDVQWCDPRPFVEGDGTEFSAWLPTGTDNGEYPELPDGETACKVAENEDMSGTQLTVVYFEFLDPRFQ